MSTKVAKVTKTSTKAVSAKAVSKVPETKTKTVVKSTKVPSVRLSEEDKKADTVTYILNTNTGKCVKRNTPLGKKLVDAEKSGIELPKTMTDTERLILVVQTIVDELNLEDSAIKAALKTISSDLPRGFPVVWGGKQKTTRSPDHPKQPSNAYIFYTKAVRQSVAEANPTLSNTEIVSLMAKMWKETAEEDRTEYNELAAEDKERYESEMKVFEAEHPDQARAKSSPGKPTKATAYHKYCEENRETVREENPDLDGKAITKLLAEQWEEVKKDKDEHAKYQSLADEANEGFEERVTDYHEGDSPKKLSEAEQAKADDPDHYELNPKTGRYVRKEEQKKAASPKVVEKKPVPKAATKAKPATVEAKETKVAETKVTKPKPKTKTTKTVSESVENDEIQEEEKTSEFTETSADTPVQVEKEDDDMLVEKEDDDMLVE